MLPQRTELPLLISNPVAFARRYWRPLAILLVGAATDAFTTYHNVCLYGASIETHPVQRLMFQVLGVQAGVPLAKLAQIVFVILVAAWWKPWTAWLIAVCGFLYLAAAASNQFMWL